MVGNCLLHHWSRTQATIALSSAEAELNAVLKASAEGLNIKQMFEELGVKMRLTIRGDASALTGMLTRKGSGRVKHLEVRQLWVQEKVKEKKLEYQKVPRAQNPADALTHSWAPKDGWTHFRKLSLSVSGHE